MLKKFFNLKFLFISLMLMSLTFFAANSAPSQQNGDSEVMIDADEIFHHVKDSLVEARGNVIVQKQEKEGVSTLKADSMFYDTEKKQVTAEGNVRLEKASGEIILGEKVIIEEDFTKSIIESFNSLLKDGSIVSAKHASKNGKIIKLKNATYTACGKLCQSSPPQWSFYSFNTEIDEEQEAVTHKNMFFRVYDFPVFYLPYLQHPTANASARSGLLTPHYTQSDYNGFEIHLPYYFRISDDKELIFTPRLLSEEKEILYQLEYNQVFQRGRFNFKSSFIRNEDFTDFKLQKVTESRFRGHVDSSGFWKINNNWNMGFDLKRTTDLSYMKKYGFSDEESLKSELYFVNSDQRNYTQIRSVSFQDLFVNERFDRNPNILPLISHHQEFARIRTGEGNFFNNSHFETDVSLMSLKRNADGDRIDRFSIQNSFVKPMNFHGNSLNAKASIAADLYDIQGDFMVQNRKTLIDHSYSRVTPELELGWSHALFGKSSNLSMMIEPVVNFVTSKIKGNETLLPNEDSVATELLPENVFLSNRFAGFDLKESGTRGSFGFRGSVMAPNAHKLSFLVGRAYYVGDPKDARIIKGIDSGLSDYVTSLNYDINGKLEIYNKTRFNHVDELQKRLSIQRNEVGTIIYFDLPVFNLKNSYDISYVFRRKYVTGKQIESREGKLSTNFHFNKNLLLSFFVRGDLGSSDWDPSKKRMIENGAGIKYDAECVSVDFSLKKNYTDDRQKGLGPSLQWKVQFFLKNLN